MPRRDDRPTTPRPHPAMLDDVELLKACEITFGRTGGPGGQHRNKVDTAAHVRHKETGITASAGERRQQHVNRAMAVKRLRLKLAVEMRRRIPWDTYEPTELWRQRRQGKQMSINPKHRDYPALLAEALDVVVARRFDVAGAAGLLGLSMSQLAKLIRHNKHAFARVNQGREDKGLPPLK